MQPLIYIPATLLLVIRSFRRNSLTPFGNLCAALTALVHGQHPSSIPFTLLVVFFLLGTSATKVKHEIKATLTLSSSGSGGGEGPRSAVQVMANSGAASALILAHLYIYGANTRTTTSPDTCFGNFDHVSEFLLLGIIANYAAVTADTLSSELGILSKSRPRLVTTLREVPPGTNGGATLTGLAAGLGGSMIIGLVTAPLLTLCTNISILSRLTFERQQLPLLSGYRLGFIVAVGIWGMLGSVLDSLLGAILQASVVDRRTGKVVEGVGGLRVKTNNSSSSSRQQSASKQDAKAMETASSRFIDSGRDILDNNQINFLMASSMSAGAMAAVYAWKQ